VGFAGRLNVFGRIQDLVNLLVYLSAKLFLYFAVFLLRYLFMKPLALITGASDGIGLELAHLHAARGGNLIVVARNTAKLEALKQTLEKQY